MYLGLATVHTVHVQIETACDNYLISRESHVADLYAHGIIRTGTWCMQLAGVCM